MGSISGLGMSSHCNKKFEGLLRHRAEPDIHPAKSHCNKKFEGLLRLELVDLVPPQSCHCNKKFEGLLRRFVTGLQT